MATQFEVQTRNILQSLEVGETGDTFVPRSTILGYNLIPTDITKDPTQKRQLYRANAFMDLYYFATQIMGKNRFSKNSDKAQNLHYQMCLTVQKDGLKEGIEIPRDHFKSTVYSECFPIWRALPFGKREEDFFTNVGYSDLYIEWMRRCHSQDIRILLVSETIKNAIKLGIRIANHYENNAFFRTLFPEIMPTEKETWTNESLHQKRTAAGRGQGEGTFDFIGVGAALQSRHYNIVVQDDLVGREARKSSIVMTDTIDYHQILVGATDSDPDNPGRDFDEIVVGNRWSHDDLNSHIRKEEPYFSWTTHSALGGCCSLHPFRTPIFPEAFTLEKLLRWKKRLGAYHFSCFAAGTPILMSNMEEKNIEDLQIGDEIVGYETSGYMSLAKAVVQATNVRKALVVEFTTASGRVFRCTPDHKFLKTSHREAERGGPYAPIIDIKRRGDLLMELVSVYTPPNIPTTEEQRDLDWLGGIFDGEGSCGVSGQTLISQSPTANPLVHAEIGATLDRLKIPWGYVNDSKQFTVQGGRTLKVRLLKYSRMAKHQRFRDSLWNKSGRVMEDGGYDQVVNVNVLGEMNVYNIQSSTGNYVAAGYATKNCQFLNYPIDPSKAKINLGDFRYFSLLRVNNALSVPKELNGLRIFDTTPMTQMRTAIRHKVAEGNVEKDVYILSPSYERYMVVDPNHGGSHLGQEVGKDGRCRHAIIVSGVMREPRRVHILEPWAEACGIKDFVRQIFKLAVKWKMRKVYIEAVAAQKYLIYHLNEFVEDNKNKYPEISGIVFLPLKTPQTAGAKQERIENFIPMIESHEIWLDENNCTKLKEECEQYGQRKGLIDLLDVLSYGPQVWKFDVRSQHNVDDIMAKQRAQFIRRMQAAVA